MARLGRLVGGIGLGLAAIGGIGAIATMPPETLAWLEENRQALRAHMPEMPPVQEIIAGQSGEDSDCDAAEPTAPVLEGSRTAPPSDCADVDAVPANFGRSAGMHGRFRAPEPTDEQARP